ncbi:flagellar biosynthetic protein FliO [Arthrobacter oryzae]|uniref:Flagellar protein n=1 Tax=Arthrobacter oryzae TaxID=409290 RepID=A0A495EAI3_9MICC|nr:flagellar biosynthetic protein FliO [Arthrobacter oryzae]RKR13599.1 flagellar protein FliO/FliZ [Arthrobacter oryzae]
MDALILGLRVVVALGAVLGLMWLLQRRLGKGTGRRRADRALTIVSRQSLGQKASVVVVDAAGQRFLLGVTEHAVNVLHTGDIPPEPEEAPVPGISRSLGDFARILAEATPLVGNHFSSQPAGHSIEGRSADASSAHASSADDTDGRVDPVGDAAVASRDLPSSRRSSLHRGSQARGPAGRGSATGASAHPPLHGSILAGSTWKQAAAALRSGRRN